MALTDVQKAIAEEQARIAAETAAAKSAAEKAAAEARKEAKAEARTAAKSKAEKDLKNKESQYKKLITQIAKGGLTDREAAVLKGQAITLSDEIDSLRTKLNKATAAAPTGEIPAASKSALGPGITPKPKTEEVSTETTAETAVTPTAKTPTGKTSTTKLTPTGAAPTPISSGTYLNETASGEGKKKSALEEAMRLYQMPDIIFNNVTELGDLLNEYVNSPTMTLDGFITKVKNSAWLRQNRGTIQNRYLQKFNYDDLVKSGQAVGNTEYEQSIKSIADQVIAEARRIGALEYADPTQAKLIAEDLYLHNMEKDTAALTKRLAGAIRMSPLGTTGLSGYTGQAQSNYQALIKLAKDNGLDINNIIPSRLVGATPEKTMDNVLAGLIDGSIDPTVIKQTARTLAAQGQPQYIKDLLAQGYDLAAIYAPYKKTMASVLELNPDQIDLNDPTLRMAITPNGDMNVYDYTKMLRKDNRWQYTQQANEEVSNITQKVLQDFGFMG